MTAASAAVVVVVVVDDDDDVAMFRAALGPTQLPTQ
jgi:hypothetical protein